MKIAIVTGASSGIGREFVKQISEQHPSLNEIWVIARRKDRLERLQGQVNAYLRIFPIDLIDNEQLNRFSDYLYHRDPHVMMLVNAAGFGKVGYFDEIDGETQDEMIRLNCGALTKMTHICLPYLVPGSRIIQMASAAAFMPQAGFAVYAATKAYVLSFSRAFRQELKKWGISVTAVCPGPVDTEFFEKAGTSEYRSPFKEQFMAKPDRVVKQALYDARKGRGVSVYGLTMNGLRLLAKELPHSWLIWLTDIIYTQNPAD